LGEDCMGEGRGIDDRLEEERRWEEEIGEGG
jgi:hypothetical protein